MNWQDVMHWVVSLAVLFMCYLVVRMTNRVAREREEYHQQFFSGTLEEIKDERAPTREEMQKLYHERDIGTGTLVRFADDLGSFFVSEDCGGDLNFHIFDLDGNRYPAFASLDPHELLRLSEYLNQRVIENAGRH